MLLKVPEHLSCNPQQPEQALRQLLAYPQQQPQPTLLTELVHPLCLRALLLRLGHLQRNQ